MEIRSVSSKNQVTIPKKMCNELSIKKGDKIVFQKIDTNLYVVSKLDQAQLGSILMIDPIEKYNSDQK